MSIFFAYFQKFIRSPLFYLGIIGVGAVCFSERALGAYSLTLDVHSEFDVFINVDSMRKVIAIFGALPFAANFAGEWTNGFTNALITRCGTKKYAASNAAVCFISSLLTVLLGTLLYFCLRAISKPLFFDDGDNLVVPYDALLKRGLPFLALFCKCFVFAASCAMWSVLGMALSAFFPNKNVAVCSPLVTSYFIERISFGLPANIDLNVLSRSGLLWENAAAQFIYSVGVFTLLAFVCGAAFCVAVKRRVQNEIV